MTPASRPLARPQIAASSAAPIVFSANISTQKMVNAAIPMVAKPAPIKAALCVTRDTRYSDKAPTMTATMA